MLIKGSEIRKMIREELSRAVMREGDGENTSDQSVVNRPGIVDRMDKPYTPDQKTAVMEIQKIIGDVPTGQWVRQSPSNPRRSTDGALFSWLRTQIEDEKLTAIEGVDLSLFLQPQKWSWVKIAPMIKKVQLKPVKYTPDAPGLLAFLRDVQAISKKEIPAKKEDDFDAFKKQGVTPDERKDFQQKMDSQTATQDFQKDVENRGAAALRESAARRGSRVFMKTIF